MSKALSGKKIVVTGAASGIGRAVANRFVREGAHVVAVDLNADGLSEFENALVVDISKRSDVEALARDLGPVDVQFNSAGFVHVGNILQTSDDEWDRSFNVNVRGTHLMMQAFLPAMLEQGHGIFINVASVGGSIRAVADRYVYGATKAAVIGLTKDIAVDFVGRGIRANCICPGSILTPTMAERIKYVAQRDGRSEDDVLLEYSDRQAIGRMGRAEEMTGLAVFLASDESSFCTGACYVADGGNTM
jgi:2-keto-3-deoxy-L-fuconate dehydrogenase